MKHLIVYGILALILMQLSVSVSAQNKKQKIKGAEEVPGKQKVFVSAGPDVGVMFPTDFGSKVHVQYQDTLFKLSPQVRFKIGMCVRTDFSKKFSFQTGLYYVERMYEAQIGRASATGDNIETMFYANSIKYTGFELPIMGLFYVQLGERWFMNNLVGFSIDFFPSSVKNISTDSLVEYKIYGGRNSWVVPSVKAAVGFEYRTERAGYFYLGAQFHRPFFAIFDGFIERKNPEPFGFQTAQLPASGTYFSVDIKYFFPTGKKNKFFD